MLEYIRKIQAARQDEEGASAVEYGLLIAGIAALIVAVVFILGGFVSGLFQDTCDNISGSASSNLTSASCS